MIKYSRFMLVASNVYVGIQDTIYKRMETNYYAQFSVRDVMKGSGENFHSILERYSSTIIQ
jgi:hypothetical protein